MTESEWLSCRFSTPMMEFLRGEQLGSHTQRTLLALACCQRLASLLSPEGRRAVEVTERFLGGQATEQERWTAFVEAGMAMDAAEDVRSNWADWCAYRTAQLAAQPQFPRSWDDDLAAMIAQTAPQPFGWTGTEWDESTLNAHRSAIADLVREIFGNPFQRDPVPQSGGASAG
jgi:hypothetical protein